ncbi:MAG: SDR family NAD(P)-dependent oxidoreductase [Egibacteraceae bacterium]
MLAARDGRALYEVAAEREARGGSALPVVTDVADERAVWELARRAVERFERIDVWVNNAGVMAYGRFEDTPAEACRRVLEVSLLGQIHGARAALRQFRAQGSGVLVNVSSLYAKLTMPYVSAYVASKYALLGLSRCLRQEVRDAAGIHVCVVLPGVVDTPIFRHAANWTGRAVTAAPPIVDPQRVVRAIVRCARRPRPEISVGQTARAMALVQAVLPRLYERVASPVMDRIAFRDQPAPPTTGNLFAPRPGTAGVRGGYRRARTAAWRAAAATSTALATASLYAVRRRAQR